MIIAQKKKSLFLLLSISFLFLGGCNNIQNQEGINQNTTTEYVVDQSDMIDGTTLIGTISTNDLAEEEKAGLVLMREEEKLARDVYMALGIQRGKQIFNNIAQSEQTHTDAIKVLLDRYGINDPVASNTMGIFTSPIMQQLYTDLVNKGKNSLLEAFIVGATVEDLDINDLEKLIQETNNEDIITVYNNLNRGSRNHLRAYIKNIINAGGTYAPQYISQSLYDGIIRSEQEKGNGAGNGKGK